MYYIFLVLILYYPLFYMLYNMVYYLYIFHIYDICNINIYMFVIILLNPLLLVPFQKYVPGMGRCQQAGPQD